MAARFCTRSLRGLFNARRNDCSGFARVVASELSVTLHGLANEVIELSRRRGLDPFYQMALRHQKSCMTAR
jgi:hypothetical protein